jgi:creatinine amidohydrolase
MTKRPRTGVLEDLTWPVVRDISWAVAMMPWGATEPHNTHLPYGTDTLLGREVAVRVSAQCMASGTNVLVLPAMPFGVNTGQLDLPMTLNVMPTTQLAVLRDIVRSIEPHGIRALVLLNAHGGNELRALVRELQPETTVMLVVVHWWKAGDHNMFAEPGDHAGALETAAVLHLAPHLVASRATWGAGTERTSVLPGVNEGWAWMPRRWTLVTDDTGVGNPQEATPDVGAAFVAQAVSRISALCMKLAVVGEAELYK